VQAGKGGLGKEKIEHPKLLLQVGVEEEGVEIMGGNQRVEGFTRMIEGKKTGRQFRLNGEKGKKKRRKKKNGKVE